MWESQSRIRHQSGATSGFEVWGLLSHPRTLAGGVLTVPGKQPYSAWVLHACMLDSRRVSVGTPSTDLIKKVNCKNTYEIQLLLASHLNA